MNLHLCTIQYLNVTAICLEATEKVFSCVDQEIIYGQDLNCSSSCDWLRSLHVHPFFKIHISCIGFEFCV